jgi:hypothetical protein
MEVWEPMLLQDQTVRIAKLALLRAELDQKSIGWDLLSIILVR